MNVPLKNTMAAWAVVAATTLTGCQTWDHAMDAGKQIAVGTGIVNEGQAEAITRSASAIAKAVESITPEQEYYIGRSVGATILQRYEPYDNRAVNAYLNVLGQTLASMSDRPETFGGYHVLALDTDEINAFAAPGGFIFVSRGMLRLCERESDVAAILAHEIGHVQGQHGLKAISRDRGVSALLVTGTELLKQQNPNLGELTEAFGGVVDGMADVLLVKGYGRRLESHADREAVAILKRVGYDPNGLVRALAALEENTEEDGSGFGKTHPNPESRVAGVQKAVGDHNTIAVPAARQKRFESFLSEI